MPIWFHSCAISGSDHKLPGKISERSAWQVRQELVRCPKMQNEGTIKGIEFVAEIEFIQFPQKGAHELEQRVREGRDTNLCK